MTNIAIFSDDAPEPCRTLRGVATLDSDTYVPSRIDSLTQFVEHINCIEVEDFGLCALPRRGKSDFIEYLAQAIAAAGPTGDPP